MTQLLVISESFFICNNIDFIIKALQYFILIHLQFISKQPRMCDFSYITGTKVGGTVCKPCEGRVNRVKVVFNRTRPYHTVLDRTWNR